MARPVRSLSPVSMTEATPMRLSAATAAAASARGSSRSARMPNMRSRANTTTTVLPSASRASTRAASGPRSAPRSAAKAGLPTVTRTPSTFATAALPGTALAARAGGIGMDRASAACSTASASGWALPASTAAATRSSPASSVPSAGSTSVTRGLPSVSVPVLSKATVRTLPSVSRAAPPLTSKPRRAPADNADATAAGTEITRAQGQAISSTARPRYTHVAHSPPNSNGGTRMTKAETTIAPGVQ